MKALAPPVPPAAPPPAPAVPPPPPPRPAEPAAPPPLPPRPAEPAAPLLAAAAARPSGADAAARPSGAAAAARPSGADAAARPSGADAAARPSGADAAAGPRPAASTRCGVAAATGPRATTGTAHAAVIARATAASGKSREQQRNNNALDSPCVRGHGATIAPSADEVNPTSDVVTLGRRDAARALFRAGGRGPTSRAGAETWGCSGRSGLPCRSTPSPWRARPRRCAPSTRRPARSG